MNLNSWDYYELEKEMEKATTADLMAMYRREKKKHLEKCTEVVQSVGKLTEERKKELKKECDLLQGGKIKVALKIADMLT